MQSPTLIPMASMRLGAPMQSDACKNQLVMQFSTFGEFDLELQLDAESLQITYQISDSISKAFPKVIQLHPEDPRPLPWTSPGPNASQNNFLTRLPNLYHFPLRPPSKKLKHPFVMCGPTAALCDSNICAIKISIPSTDWAAEWGGVTSSKGLLTSKAQTQLIIHIAIDFAIKLLRIVYGVACRLGAKNYRLLFLSVPRGANWNIVLLQTHIKCAVNCNTKT